jgi:hypothetical protein
LDATKPTTTDLIIIAREMQRAGAGIRLLAEPFVLWRLGSIAG